MTFKPYCDDQTVEAFLAMERQAHIDNLETAIAAYQTLPKNPTRIRGASDVLIIGDTLDDPTPIIEHLQKDAITEPIIVSTVENTLTCKEMIGRLPEFIIETAPSTLKTTINEIPDKDLTRSILFYPLTLRPHNKKVKTIYYYSTVGLSHLPVIKCKECNIPIIHTFLDPLTTTLALLIKYQYLNIHLIQPLTVYETAKKYTIQVKTIKGTGHTKLSTIISNTMFKYWLKKRNKYPKINLTLYYPTLNIFGYKVKQVKKQWTIS